MTTRTSEGFTLIEVLVALAVFSIGMLGLVSLMLLTFNSAQNSHYRNTAIVLANDMINRMQANLSGVSNGSYNNPGNLGVINNACFGQNLAGSNDSSYSCNANQMAANDLAEWYNDIATLLPNGQAVLCIDSTPDDGTPLANQCDGIGSSVYTIKIWWSEKSNNDNHQFNTQSQIYWITFQP